MPSWLPGSILFTTVVACILTLNCCKKKDRDVVYIDQTTKDYCVFKKGSWWVYEHAATGFKDTVTVYRFENKINSIPEFLSYDFEETHMYTVWSSFGHDITKANPFIRVTTSYSSGGRGAVAEEQTPYISGPNIIYNPLSNVGEHEVFIESDSLIYTAHYDSLVIGPNTYYDVMELSTTTNFSNLRPKKIRWARNVGRISYQTYEGDIWNLVDYNVIQ